MASIIKEIIIEASPADVWAVIGDFADGPTRMAPGYVTDTRIEAPDTRVVTFANGDVAREQLIARDHTARRIVYAWTGGWAQPTHNNASFHVLADGEDRSRLVWIHDVLPDNLTEALTAAMDGGLTVIKETIEHQATPAR